MEENEKKIAMAVFLILPVLLTLFVPDYYAYVWILVLAFAGVAYYMKITDKRKVLLIVISFFIFSIAYMLYLLPASYIARGQGTVLSDNWFQALNWIKNNTPECAVVATYWDPGHFITGIARRPVVFDGASQSTTRTIQANNTEEGVFFDHYEKGIVQTIKKTLNTTTRARIKDIAITLFTDNETRAVEILKDYMKPNCTEMYYIASGDLVGKSVWWTYFATWDPEAPEGASKGKQYSYIILSLSRARPLIAENAIAYEYNMNENQKFILYERNGSLTPYLQIGPNFQTVEKMFYWKTNNAELFVQQNADVKGLIWLSPDKNTLIYMQPELENAMFTKMFFFEGAMLDHFKFVGNWGGEVKLFRIHFNETEQV